MLHHISSMHTELKTQQNIVLMAAVLTWCENIFVGCTFARSLPFLILSISHGVKKFCYINTGVHDFEVAFFKAK